MAWYAFTTDLVGERADNIRKKTGGVVVEITRPGVEAVVAFPEELRATAFQIAKIDPANTEEVATSREDVILIVKKRPPVVPEIGSVKIVLTDYLEAWDEMEPVLREFARKHQVQVETANVHGRWRRHLAPNPAPNCFQILFFSNLATKEDEFVEAKYPVVFGVRAKYDQPFGLAPTGIGFPIPDDTGQVVAESMGNSIHILFDLPHDNGPAAAEMLRKILQRFEDLGGAENNPADRARMMEEINAKVLRASRDQYIKECARRIDSLKRETEEGLQEANAALQRVSQEIVTLTRRVEGLRHKQQQLEATTKGFDGKFGEEYDRLLEVPHVRKVVVRDGLVSVFTDTIFLDYDGQRWELGDYRIDIYTAGSLKIVNLRVKELTGGQNFYHHPHIFEPDGRNVCLGNIREGVFRLIGQYEYAMVAQLLIEFLHTMTRDYQYIRHLVSNWKPLPTTAEKTAA